MKQNFFLKLVLFFLVLYYEAAILCDKLVTDEMQHVRPRKQLGLSACFLIR